MKHSSLGSKTWVGIPPWIILGSLLVLVPIFVFITLESLHRQKENTVHLLVEKGAALIRSFEAGTRTGMMGMMGMRGSDFQLQSLLSETAKQPDIAYIVVTDLDGYILAHNDPARIGGVHGRDLDLRSVSRSENIQWRQLLDAGGSNTFEVFRKFSPLQAPFRRPHGGMMSHMRRRSPTMVPEDVSGEVERIIFVGLDMGAVETARAQDSRHTLVMAVVLLLIGMAGVVSLFLAQAYRSARSSLSRVKAFSDKLVENLPIGLVAMDPGGKIVALNQAAEGILGVSFTSIAGGAASEVLPRELLALARRLKTEKEIIGQEIDCTAKDGRSTPLEVSGALLYEETETFAGYLILMRNLAEIKSLQKEVERSRRLASIGRLAAGVAHEIRNPLSSIKGFATYFKERYGDNSEDQGTAEIMIQEVDRLNRVITQLLEFARPMSLEKKTTSLQALVRHSLKMVEADAKRKGISLRMDLPEQAKEVRIDPDKMKQVLLNLYLNAIESMETQGALTVELRQHPESLRTQIIVSDTGSGIKDEDLVHVFDPYFTTKAAGSGLGLAIVHKIVESHNGEVKVESRYGGGTSVSVLLPP